MERNPIPPVTETNTVILGKQKVIPGRKAGQVQMNVSQDWQSDISYNSATDLLDTLSKCHSLRIHSKNIYAFPICLAAS